MAWEIRKLPGGLAYPVKGNIQARTKPTIDYSRVGLSQQGHLVAAGTNTFTVAAMSGKNFEVQSIKNISTLLSSSSGQRSKVKVFKVRFVVYHYGTTQGTNYPVIVYPFLVNLASSSSISTTESNTGTPVEAALSNGISGEFSFQPTNQFTTKHVNTYWNGENNVHLFAADVEVDLTSWIQSYADKISNNPAITDTVLHLCAVLYLQEAQAVYVLTELEYELELTKRAFI